MLKFSRNLPIDIVRKKQKDYTTMGMASSQARLLSITSRMHDIELQAQSIEAQKIRLAIDEDAVYQKYCDALDATKITVAYQGDLTTNYVDANFSTMCGFNSDRMKDYLLINNVTGLVIVDEKIKEIYDGGFGNDKYQFALACLGYDIDDFLATGMPNDVLPEEVGIGTLTQSTVDANEGTGNCFMNQVERIAYEENKAEHPELEALYNDLCDICSDTSDATQKEKEEALAKFRDALYCNIRDRGIADKILEIMNLETVNDTYNADHSLLSSDHPDVTFESIKNEFNYYVALWQQIHDAGGCEVIDSKYASGADGTEWLNNMVKSGLVSIYSRPQTGMEGFTETSVATSIGRNYLQEAQDESKVKKAEAEYQHDLKIINNKDTKFDQELKKLETERTALKTEQEGVETIRKDNTEQNFNIFS